MLWVHNLSVDIDWTTQFAVWRVLNMDLKESADVLNKGLDMFVNNEFDATDMLFVAALLSDLSEKLKPLVDKYDTTKPHTFYMRRMDT